MKNFGIKQIGFYQTGTVKGGLQPQNYSGSWGDRGQGNELLSVLEKGLSWIYKNIINPEKDPYVQYGTVPLPLKFGTTTAHKLLESPKVALKTKLQIAPLLGRARAGNIMKDSKVVEAQEIRKSLYERFKSLYKKLNLPEDNSLFRTKTPTMKSINTEDIDVSKTNSPLKDSRNIGGYYNKREHSIYIPSHIRKGSNIDGIEDVGFHETLHAFGLGEGPSYAWKVKYLNFPKTKSSYWQLPEEVAVHTILAGQRLGIVPGQPYPGKEAFLALIEKEGLTGIALLLYRNAKNNKDYIRLWSLLNGTF